MNHRGKSNEQHSVSMLHHHDMRVTRVIGQIAYAVTGGLMEGAVSYA